MGRQTFKLVFKPGQPDERTFDLREGLNTIGRLSTSDVFVLDSSLSRQHASVTVDNGRVFLADLQSKNGTFFQGAQIKTQELRGGDFFLCGDLLFKLQPGQASDSTTHIAPTRIYNFVDENRMEDLLSSGSAESSSALKMRPRDSMERTRDKLQILLRVSETLSSPGGLDETLHRVLELVFLILDVDRAAILLEDPDTGELKPRVVRSREGVTTPGRVYSEHIVNYVREHGVAALFANTLVDPRLDLGSADSIMNQSICAAVCAPLKAKDKRLGVLYVDNLHVPNRFSEEDLEFVSSFANQASIAIDNALLYQRLEKEAVLRNNYQRFFPPTTLRRLDESREATLGVLETEVTILFADIVDFTGLSSRLRPKEVVDVLNEYFPMMSEIVFRYEGTLEKYIGDALMAVWGAPFKHPLDADRAVRAAVEMQQQLAEMNARWRAQGRVELRIHIGLNSGPVAAGNIGSERYLQYATIGDATNVASRVCGVAHAGQILLTDSTRTLLQERRWPLRPLPPTQVKGKLEHLELHEVLWREGSELEPR